MKILFWKYLECALIMIVCSCHVTHAFQSESTLSNCLNVKELPARSRREIWSLSDCNWTQTHNHLVPKLRLNHLAKLAKWLSCVVSTYLFSAFENMFLSYHVRVSEWVHTIVAWMWGSSLLEAGPKSEGEVTATGLQPTTTSLVNDHSTI